MDWEVRRTRLRRTGKSVVRGCDGLGSPSYEVATDWEVREVPALYFRRCKG
jgi:hypothetical protein